MSMPRNARLGISSLTNFSCTCVPSELSAICTGLLDRPSSSMSVWQLSSSGVTIQVKMEFGAAAGAAWLAPASMTAANAPLTMYLNTTSPQRPQPSSYA